MSEPDPTRDDIHDAAHDALGPWVADNDAEQQEDLESAVDDVTDAVMALLSTQPATTVLWEGPTIRRFGDGSRIDLRFDVPPGTHVVVTCKAAS